MRLFLFVALLAIGFSRMMTQIKRNNSGVRRVTGITSSLKVFDSQRDSPSRASGAFKILEAG